MFGRVGEASVHAAMRALHARYVVVSFAMCDQPCFDGVTTSADIAALGAGAVRARLGAAHDWGADGEQFCFYSTERRLRHFETVFQNAKYLVLKVL